MSETSEAAVSRIAADLLDTDALTPNHDGTPEHYVIEADNVEYLVVAVLSLAAGREAQAAVELAADAMEDVIASGDVAEVAAFVPGEVGRARAVERRDFLYEDPVDWLRAYAGALTPARPASPQSPASGEGGGAG